MPGSSWAQRRGDFADFADSHDIAEQGFNVELRQLSRSSSSWETEGCTQKLSLLPETLTGKELKKSPLPGSGLWQKVAPAFAFAFAFARPNIPRSIPQLQPEDFSEAYKLGYERFQYPSFETQPCGWPQFAAFLESCDSFGIYRRFGQSHTRLLITYETDITKLEKEIHELDVADEKSEDGLYRLTTTYHREGLDSTKRDLLTLLEKKLLAYGALLLQHQQIKALPRTPDRDHKSVFRWIWSEKPVDEGEYDWIYLVKDFVSLVPPDRNQFESFVRSHIDCRPISWLKKLLQDKNPSARANDSAVQFFALRSIDMVARLIVVFFAVAVLFVPVILFLLTPMSRPWMAVVVLAFVFIFAIIISLLTNADMQEIFIGTSTYCAVIVMFLGNLQNPTG